MSSWGSVKAGATLWVQTEYHQTPDGEPADPPNLVEVEYNRRDQDWLASWCGGAALSPE